MFENICLSDDDLILKIKDIPGVLTTKSDDVLISLNTSLSEKLLAEGFSREFINKVQNIRKDQRLSVVDKINITISGDLDAINMVLNNDQYVKDEVLATTITSVDSAPKNNTLFEFNNYKMYIAVENE